MKGHFLDDKRYLKGPWQAFERDFARFLIVRGFDDVRIVGGPGDAGADVLGVRNGKLWVFQCKHMITSRPSTKAIKEVVKAKAIYHADKLGIVISLPANKAIIREIIRYKKIGIDIEIFEPARVFNIIKDLPEYSNSKKTLWDYQQEASESFYNSLIESRKAQMIMATGMGKSVIMAEVVADLFRSQLLKNSRVLITAHTREIVRQLHQCFWHQLPIWVHTHQLMGGEFPSYWEGITFATIQSVKERIRELPTFDLLLIDEAHHVGAATYRDVVNRLEPQMIGGVTATPWRGDRYDIDVLLGTPCVKIGIAEGLQKGFLSDVDYKLYADNLDWDYVREASNYNYSLSQLNRKLIIPKRDAEAARIITEIFKKENRRGGIVFSPRIEHAYSFAGHLRHMGFRAECISSDLPPREQEILMARFRAGNYDFVTTVDLFNEGVDVPDIDMVVFLRATHSRRIFVQQLGRGLRASQGKDKVIVLDFVSDLRRIAEVIRIDNAIRSNQIERLGLGKELIQFSNQGAGNFLRDWMLDQADFILREDDPTLKIPDLDFPEPVSPGTIQ